VTFAAIEALVSERRTALLAEAEHARLRKACRTGSSRGSAPLARLRRRLVPAAPAAAVEPILLSVVVTDDPPGERPRRAA